MRHTNTDMASLTVRNPDSLERQLIAASNERGISKSDIAREAIERDMRVEAWRKLRDQFRPYLEAQGLFTEEDVLRRLYDAL
jgi:predicted transcriptional regulator